ncbi:hypothetical protein LTR05_004650 [Lithohypha guttulata]|uniref:Uncharacterized protein n=1 Tax=Lithohypha guttulata TaxID=1690604 RepID=A0AAN7YAL3_9EURO|nr:hypothetical protein LTR05_004650 [Lithohypha guttulata]
MPRTTRNSLETADARDLEALATSRSIEESSLPETPPKAQVQTSGLKAYAFTPSSTNYTTNEHQFVVSETRPHQTIRAPHAQETEFLPPNPSSSPRQYLLSRTEQINSQHAYPDPYHPTFTAERDPEVLEAARTLLDIYYSTAAIPAEREADESRQTVGSSFVLSEPVPLTDTARVEADANGSSGRRWFSATPWLRRRPRPIEPTMTAEDRAYSMNLTLEAINSSPAKKLRKRRAAKTIPEEDNGIDMEMGNQDGSTSSMESDTTLLEDEISELTNEEEQSAADEDDELRDYGPKHLPHFRLENKYMIRRPGRGLHEAPIDDSTSDEPQPFEEAARTKT